MTTEKDETVRFEEARRDDAPPVAEHDEGEDKMSFQAWMAAIAVHSQFLAYLNTLLMPSTILSYIIADLPPNPNYPWITVSWNVAASVMVTVGGRMSDIFGRRWFLIVGSIVALCGAVVGATASSVNQLIASGVLFGFGGGLQEMCYAMLQEIVPMKYRVRAIGMFDFGGMIALMSPLIAWAMLSTTSLGWRTVYWYLFAFEAYSLGMIIVFYRPPNFTTKHRRDGKTRWQTFKQLDFIGIGLFSAGCIIFLVGVNWGGRQYDWSSAPVIATLIVGVVLLVALGFYEAYANLEYPMLPPKFFKNIRGFTVLLVVCFVGGMLYYSMNVLWPRQSTLLFVPADRPIIAGVYANMVSFGTITAGFIVLTFCHRVGHERWQQVGFMIAQTALIGSLASIGINDRAQAIATIVVLAMCITPPQLLSFAMISIGIDNQVDIGVANGLASTFRLMGGAVATAIYSAILDNKFASSLPSKMAPVISANDVSEADAQDLLAAAALNTAEAYETVPNISPAIIEASQGAVRLAYVEGFKLVYLVAIAFGILACIAAFFTRTIPKEKKTMHRAIRMENEAGGARADQVGEGSEREHKLEDVGKV